MKLTPEDFASDIFRLFAVEGLLNILHRELGNNSKFVSNEIAYKRVSLK